MQNHPESEGKIFFCKWNDGWINRVCKWKSRRKCDLNWMINCVRFSLKSNSQRKFSPNMKIPSLKPKHWNLDSASERFSSLSIQLHCEIEIRYRKRHLSSTAIKEFESIRVLIPSHFNSSSPLSAIGGFLKCNLKFNLDATLNWTRRSEGIKWRSKYRGGVGL